MIMILIVVILILVLAMFMVKREPFQKKGVAPWDKDDCELMCIQAGERWQPWVDGDVDGAWNDPALQPDSNFDVAACLRRC